ncbi:MAG: phosphoribosylamine--glycine ligase [Clostridiales bacterium]|nr:phosphoribosylamine--glycine ligase [Clostridiales bacterium]
MNILVLGSGGREHTIVWKLSLSDKVDSIHVIPGNPGMLDIATIANINLSNQEEILKYAVDNNIDLLVVGPEQPLVDGIADKFRKEGIKVFGPGKLGAQLEGSKIFSKEFMVKHGILTAKFDVFTNKEDAIKGIEKYSYPLVIKVDGLAAGKGVLIPKTKEEAINDLSYIFDEKKFGDAGDRVLVEEFIGGFEASILCLVDENSIVSLESARDYKKAYNDDKGLNTGGMGSISPNDKLTDEMTALIEKEVLQKTLNGLKKDNIDFNGVLFIGLIINEKNEPYILEYNVRFGDPETQSVIPKMKNDLLEVFMKTVENELSELKLKWDERVAVTTVLASGGYPESYEKGKEITFENIDDDVMIFHAGTKLEDGKLVTDGGRVLGVTTLAEDKYKAREKIYKNIDKIHFDEKMYRTDIGL